MALILLVEDTPDLVLYEGRVLESAGHRVFRCSGGPTPFAACTMLRYGNCPLPEAADLIIFDCGMIGPMRHRTYRGIHLLRAYRAHALYGLVPMLVIAETLPDGLEGSGPIESIPKFSEPRAVVEAVEGLLLRERGSTRILASTTDAGGGPGGPSPAGKSPLFPGRSAGFRALALP